MMLVAKGCEALGIACVMIGLVQGIQSSSMWMELYLSILGIVLFLVGWGIEKWIHRKRTREAPTDNH
jgi:protein-S-isoprenylcysteine O-methyltransferase Ste14